MAVGAGISSQLGFSEEVYTNEIQTITGTPSATFGLNFDGALTSVSLTTTATAASIQAALEALPNIGTGGVAATGGPLPGAVTVTFSGSSVSKRDVPALVVQGSVTGLTIATPTPGTGYGTFAVPARFLEFNSESLAERIEWIRSAGLRAGNRIMRSDRMVRNPKGAGGAVTWEVQTKGFGMLLKHCLGAIAISTPATGVNTRDHTATLGDLCNQSLTIQKGVPRQECVALNVDAFTFLGSRCTDWELSCDVDGILTLSMTFDSQQLDTSQALASASYPASTELLTFTQATVNVDGALAEVHNFSLSGTNPQNTDRYYLRNSTLKKQPLINGFSEVTGAIEMDYNGQSRAAYDKFRAGTVASLTALFEGSIIEGALRYGVLVTLPAIRFTGETPQVGGPDLVNLSLPYEVLNDGTNEPVTIRLRTTDTVS